MSFLPELPSLNGTRGRVVRVVYRVLAVVVIAITILGIGATARDEIWDAPAEAQFGIAVASDASNRPVLDHVWPEAEAAGAQAGARVIGVNGAPLGPDATRFSIERYTLGSSKSLRLDLATDDGHVAHVRLARDPGLADRLIPDEGLGVWHAGLFDTVNSTFFAVCTLVLSLLLFLRRPRDPEAMLLAFGFLLMALQLRPIAGLIPPDGPMARTSVFWLGRTIYTAGFWCMLVGICAFPDGRFVSRWSRVVRWIPTTYLIVNTATRYALWHWSMATYVVDIPIFVLVVGSLVIRYRLLPSGSQRQQIKWALLGGAVMVAAALALALVTTAPAQAFLGAKTVTIASMVLDDCKQLAFPLGLLISLLRYRLYDADTVIVRSAAYAGLSVALVAAFACTEQFAQTIGQDEFGDRLGPLASGLGAAMAAVLIAPLHRRITGWAERRFRAALTTLRLDLPKMLDDARETSTSAELGVDVLDRVIASVHARHGAVLLHDTLLAVTGIDAGDLAAWRHGWRSTASRQRLQADPDDPVFPLRIALSTDRSGLVGWLLLGSRPDDSLYGKDEQEALREIAVPVASALVVSELRQRRDAEVADLRGEIGLVRRLVEELRFRTTPA